MRLKSLLLVCIMTLFSAIPALAVGTLELGPVTVTGTNVAFDVTLTNDPAIQLSALGVDISFNKDVFSIIPDVDSGPGFALNAELGAAAVAAKKTLDQSNPSSGVLRFAISGKTTSIGDGLVAKVTFPITTATPGTYTFAVTPSGSDKLAVNYILTGKNTTYTIQAQPATVTAFTISPTVESLTKTIPITTFTGSNATGFIVTESATAPAANDTKWTSTAPTTYIASSYGSKTLYAWVKNATDTVSVASMNAVTSLTEPSAAVTKFEIPSNGFSLTIPITTFTASSNAVAYLVTENATAPAAGDITSATPPATITVTGFTAHTLYAWVKNASGVVSASASATITLSEKPAPVLIVNTLAANSFTNNKTLNITGSATKNPADGSGAVASLKVNGTDVTLNADGSFSTAVNLIEGVNTITVVATDNQTPPVTSTDVRTITYDVTAPALTVTTPTNNSQTNVASVTITGTVSETATVTISQNGAASQPAVMNGTTFSLSVALVEGDNTFNLTATDLATNAFNAEQLKIKLDTAKPTLAITSPAQDITTTLANYLVTGTTSDDTSVASVDFKVDGISVAPAPVVENGTFQQSVTLTSVATKTYAVNVTVTDTAGNTSSVQRNIIFRALGLADALKALQISVGLVEKTADDKDLDVAPLLNGKPKGDGLVDAGDAGVILRKLAGFENW